LNVTIAGPAVTPTGGVTFLQGGVSVGTATLVNGQARLATSLLRLGPNAITARYEGDASYLGSASAPSELSVVGLSTLRLTVPAGPYVAGRLISLTARVAATAGDPSGTVDFFAGATFLGTANVSAGTATLNSTALTVGNHALNARFTPSSPHLPSESGATNIVVGEVPGTAITSLNTVRRGTTVVRVELRLNGPIDVAGLARLTNFQFAFAGPDRRFGTRDDQPIALSAPRYDARTGLITLTPRRPLTLTGTARLVVQGLTDDRRRPLDGDRDGKPGGRFSVLITSKGWSFGG
jgi:hypothetical protein